MATEAADTSFGRNPVTIGQFVDRWIYVFTAALFVVTALAGFIPDSAVMLERIRAGQHAPLSPIFHFHAVAMGSWLLLFLAQTVLMATGRRQFHKTLGLLAVVLVPLIVATMIGMTFTTYRWQYSAAAAAALPAAALAGGKTFAANILIEQIHAVITFPLFVGWALAVRKTDPESHKRFMVQAILPALTAATARITWLPHTLPGSYAAEYGYALLCLTPALVNDLIQQRRLHSAYVIGLALMLAFFVLNQVLWDSPWWLATAPKLMGVGSL
jgi:hypothetical protein